MNSKTEDEERITSVTFRIPQTDIDLFDSIAKERRTTRAALLRECVLTVIKKQENK